MDTIHTDNTEMYTHKHTHAHTPSCIAKKRMVRLSA